MSPTAPGNTVPSSCTAHGVVWCGVATKPDARSSLHKLSHRRSSFISPKSNRPGSGMKGALTEMAVSATKDVDEMWWWGGYLYNRVYGQE